MFQFWWKILTDRFKNLKRTNKIIQAEWTQRKPHLDILSNGWKPVIKGKKQPKK